MADGASRTVGFIGLGNMGLPMARNLQKAGLTVAAYDVVADRLADLAASGARLAMGSAKEVAAKADIVFTILPSEKVVREIYLGADGLVHAARAGTLLVDLSTISADLAREIAAAAAERGVRMMDAPVSGGVKGAAAGTLTFMVGHDGAEAARLDPPLAAMGEKIVYCGGPGAGQVVKICNNLIVGISMIATAEAMALGARQGVDPKLLTDVIGSSTGNSWCVGVQNPYPGVIKDAPSSHGYRGGAAVEILLKDVGLAVEAASRLHMPMFLGGLTKQVYELAIARGLGGLDFSSVVRLYDDSARTDSVG